MNAVAASRPAPRFDQFEADPVTVAKRLLGRRLVRVHEGVRLAGTIVEVEAYLGAKDRAAHTYGGRRTARNASMYLPGGHAYVYFIYGLHHCLNVVCGKADEGVAVLIRALEPTEGLERIAENRGMDWDAASGASQATSLCSGPAKLTQALAISRTFDGVDLRRSHELFIEDVLATSLSRARIERSSRIGVDYAGAWARKPLRFAVRNNPHVSR